MDKQLNADFGQQIRSRNFLNPFVNYLNFSVNFTKFNVKLKSIKNRKEFKKYILINKHTILSNAFTTFKFYLTESCKCGTLSEDQTHYTVVMVYQTQEMLTVCKIYYEKIRVASLVFVVYHAYETNGVISTKSKKKKKSILLMFAAKYLVRTIFMNDGYQ